MPDKETKEILSEADHVKAMIGSDGWKSVETKLKERILDLQNINNLDVVKIETLPQQLAARKMAVEVIWDWLKKDVYGFVEQQESNAQKLLNKDYGMNYIGRE